MAWFYQLVLSPFLCSCSRRSGDTSCLIFAMVVNGLSNGVGYTMVLNLCYLLVIVAGTHSR